MRTEETFIQFVANIISNEYFINGTQAYKDDVMSNLEKLFEGKITASRDGGYHEGYMAGMENARKIFLKTYSSLPL